MFVTFFLYIHVIKKDCFDIFISHISSFGLILLKKSKCIKQGYNKNVYILIKISIYKLLIIYLSATIVCITRTHEKKNCNLNILLLKQRK